MHDEVKSAENIILKMMGYSKRFCAFERSAILETSFTIGAPIRNADLMDVV